MTYRPVGERDVGLIVALVSAATGVVAGRPTLLLAATIGLAYAAYEASTGRPEPDLEIARTLSPTAPGPGDRVSVDVTVRNCGESLLPDLRVLDGVPRRLRVVDGSPRFGTALEPGESATFSYALRARRGDHPFRETTVVSRTLSGDAASRETVAVESTVSCRVDVDELVPAPETRRSPGQVETSAPGDGVTFYGVREYQSADPINRIDWNRYARSGTLTTVEYESVDAASVVLLVDERFDESAGPRDPTASQLSKYAAERLGTALLAETNRVGAALFHGGDYLRPRTDRGQLLRIRRLLLYECPPDAAPAADGPPLRDGFAARAFRARDAHGARGDADVPVRRGTDRAPSTAAAADRHFGSPVTDGGTAVDTFHRRFPDDAQVVFCTPLLDDRARDAARRLAALGRSVTVLSPDVTAGDSPGSAVERITRADRFDDLRDAVTVVDWSPDEPLATALARATGRWSR